MVLWDSQGFGVSSALGYVAVQDPQKSRKPGGSGCTEVQDEWRFGMLSSSGWEHNEQQFEMYGGLG